MIYEFRDSKGESAHGEFQTWRRQNQNGYFINVKPGEILLLHRTACSHPGDAEWEPADHPTWGSLTKYAKVCSTDLQELQAWAKATYGREDVSRCTTCRPE